jgi:hypothetical protein
MSPVNLWLSLVYSNTINSHENMYLYALSRLGILHRNWVLLPDSPN